MAFARRLLRGLFLIVLLVFGVMVGIHNRELMQFSFPPLLTSITLPSFMILLTSFALGALVATLWFAQDSIAKSMRIRKLEKRLGRFEDLRSPEALAKEPFFKRQEHY